MNAVRSPFAFLSRIVRASAVLAGALLLALVLCGLLAGEVARAAPLAQSACTVTVTSAADDGAGSLRQIIATAAAGDIICFDASLSNQTITLVSEIAIGVDVTISGTIPITLSGNSLTRLFSVNAADPACGDDHRQRHWVRATAIRNTVCGSNTRSHG